jgi:uncharacterized membrane protein
MNYSWITSFYQFLNHFGYSHPIHPALVHLPIGLVAGAFILGWLAFLFNRDQLARSARHCLTLAFLFWFPVVLFGFMDWQHFYKGVWLTPIKVKMGLSGILFILFLVALVFGFRKKGTPKTALTVYTLGLMSVVLLGFFGAQLVYERKTPEVSKTYLAGEKIFTANCITCHPGGGNILIPDHPIINSPKLKNPDTFISWIRNPIAPMPKFPESKISVGQAKELYLYLTDVLSRPNGNNRGS